MTTRERAEALVRYRVIPGGGGACEALPVSVDTLTAALDAAVAEAVAEERADTLRLIDALRRFFTDWVRHLDSLETMIRAHAPPSAAPAASAPAWRCQCATCLLLARGD